MNDVTLVCGATGTVGSRVVARLAASGLPVRAGTRSPESVPAPVSGADWVRLVFSDPDSVAAAFEGVTTCVMITPLAEDMAEVAARLVSEAARQGTRHVVRLSALGADWSPATRLGAAHRRVERIIEASGVAWTMLRPNAFMQNIGNYFARAIRARGTLAMPQGDGRVSAVDVRDVADVAVAAVTDGAHRGRCYDLTGPRAVSNAEVAQILSRVLGRKVRYLDSDPGETRAAMLDSGMSPWLVDLTMELYAVSAGGRAAGVSPCVARILGRPPVDFRQYARDHAEVFR